MKKNMLFGLVLSGLVLVGLSVYEIASTQANTQIPIVTASWESSPIDTPSTYTIPLQPVQENYTITIDEFGRLDMHSCKLQSFLEDLGSPLASYRTYWDRGTKGKILLTAGEILTDASDNPSARVNTRIILTYLQMRWNLLENKKLESKEIDEMVIIYPDQDKGFHKQIIYLAYDLTKSINNSSNSISDADDIAKIAIQNTLKLSDKEWIDFYDIYQEYFGVDEQQPKNSEKLSSMGYAYPLADRFEITSFFDHGDLEIPDYELWRFDNIDVSDSTCNAATNPITCYDRHNGIDYDTGTGDDVLAAAAGTVEASGDISMYCEEFEEYRDLTRVRIVHSNDERTRYWHLSSTSVNQNDTVTAGQKVGESGSSGCVTGDHLHFRIDDSSGTPVDPYGSWRATSYQPLLEAAASLEVIEDDDSDNQPGFERFGPDNWTRVSVGDDGYSFYTFGEYNHTLIGYVNFAQWWADIPSTAYYTVSAYIPSGSDMSTEAHYRIRHKNGTAEIEIDQDDEAGSWVTLGSWEFEEGSLAMVILTDKVEASANDDKRVYFDTVKWVAEDQCASLQTDITLTNRQFDDEVTCQATNNITAQTNVTIEQPDADVTFEAGNQIRLLPGFHAESGSEFRAWINDEL